MDTDWTNKKECLEAVKEDGYALRYVKEQTLEICLEAVKENGYALRYVKEQTPEICLEAVKEYGKALRHVKKQTPEICVQAILNNEGAKGFVNPEILESEEFIQELLMETI